MISTIPPIYERSTASNISFEETGGSKVSEKCNPLSKQSSASHGVKLRPAASPTVFGATPLEKPTETSIVFGVSPIVKTPDIAMGFGTTPLLSPTMETELPMNSWATQLFNNPKMQISGPEEDSSAFSIWEENYQDLSGWCMDPFQGQCAFPIGEFETNEYSGTKNEANSVSRMKSVVNDKDSGVFVKEEGTHDKSSPAVMELPFVDAAIDTHGESLLMVKPEIVEMKTNDAADVTTKSAIAMRTDDWIRLVTVDGTSELLDDNQSESANDKNNSISINEYLSPIAFDPPKIGKNNWDAINTFETTATDSFDLLSYLCDDNIQSPDGSISRDSGPTINSTSSVASPVSSATRKSRNNRRNKIASESYAEASTSSSSIAAISAALDSVSKMSRRSSRPRNWDDARTRRTDREGVGRGKKRCADSDSEDRMSDCSYRESREKNNEASRKSRMNKKAKENEMMARSGELEKDNRILKMKVEELEKLVTSMRTTILRSALKRTF